jgi:hypothetical protein
MLFETISLAGDTPSIYHYSSLQQDDCRQHNFHLLLEQKTLCFEESSPSQLPKADISRKKTQPSIAEPIARRPFAIIMFQTPNARERKHTPRTHQRQHDFRIPFKPPVNPLFITINMDLRYVSINGDIVLFSGKIIYKF